MWFTLTSAILLGAAGWGCWVSSLRHRPFPQYRGTLCPQASALSTAESCRVRYAVHIDSTWHPFLQLLPHHKAMEPACKTCPEPASADLRPLHPTQVCQDAVASPLPTQHPLSFPARLSLGVTGNDTTEPHRDRKPWRPSPLHRILRSPHRPGAASVTIAITAEHSEPRSTVSRSYTALLSK